MGSIGKKFHLGKNKKVGTFQDASIDSDDQGRQRRGLLNQQKMFFFLNLFLISIFLFTLNSKIYLKKKKKEKNPKRRRFGSINCKT